MTRTRILLAAVTLCSLSQTAFARIHQPSLRDREQAACYNDAMRLCKDAVPNEAKIARCMRAKIAQVSTGCRRYFH